MPSDPHDVLYHRIRNITTRAKAVVEDSDLDALPGLIQEHKDVMAVLKEAGFSSNPALLGLVTEIRDQVEEVMIGIKARQDEIGQQLKASGAKRKLDRAYGV